MADPLDALRAQVHCPADAVRWACILEATAAKVGNVYPGKPFADLRYLDFVVAAEIASESLGETAGRLSQRMLNAVEKTTRQCKTNVNLGIVLLLGPLVEADRSLDSTADRSKNAWLSAIHHVLEGFDGVDGENIYRAIGLSSAGGLGEVDEFDVQQTSGSVDLIAAMRLAESRDRIARQYCGGFADLLESVVPELESSLMRRGDTLAGITLAQLRLLAQQPDSLIARKNGQQVASEVQSRAQKVDVDDPVSVARFDEWLREDSHRLNPGTTADLIAAGLYYLLRTPPE